MTRSLFNKKSFFSVFIFSRDGQENLIQLNELNVNEYTFINKLLILYKICVEQ